MELTLFGFPLPFLSESHMNSDVKAHRSLSGRPFSLLFWSACTHSMVPVCADLNHFRGHSAGTAPYVLTFPLNQEAWDDAQEPI